MRGERKVIVHSRRLLNDDVRPLKLFVRHLRDAVPLTKSEQQSIGGAVAFGLIVGLLCALASLGLHSEYGNNLTPTFPGVTNFRIDAALICLAIWVGVTLTFGALPVWLGRLLSRHRNDA
jgi:hypothetical protein